MSISQPTLFPLPRPDLERYWHGRKRYRNHAAEAKRAENRGHHEHSIKTYYKQKPKMSGRRLAIYMDILDYGPSTDREVLQRLYPGGDMNMVRPRISELLDMGELEEVGKATDAATGMTVRVVDLKDRMR